MGMATLLLLSDTLCDQHGHVLLSTHGQGQGLTTHSTWPQLWYILSLCHDSVKRIGSSMPQRKPRRGVMEPTITAEIVVAYAQCPRKAYLLLFSPDRGEPHEYVQILEQQRCEHQKRYLDRLQQKHADVQP